RKTPQSQPIPGSVPNSAGGHSFAVSDWTLMDRFLILGTEGGTYYIGEGELTKGAAQAVARCLDEDYKRAVDRIVEIPAAGRNPKQNPLRCAYAMACGHANTECRQYALSFLPQVCRIGTHLFVWVGYVEMFRGWGRSLRNAVTRWYISYEREGGDV